MKKIVRLLLYVVTFGIMLYAAGQLYQPGVVRAGACCNSNAACGQYNICAASSTIACTFYQGECLDGAPLYQ